LITNPVFPNLLLLPLANLGEVPFDSLFFQQKIGFLNPLPKIYPDVVRLDD